MATTEPGIILDLIESFRRSKAMFTAASLGLFDRLTGTAATAQELALELGLHEGALVRLLDGCAALGLLERAGAGYRNSAVADDYLRRASPDSLAGYVLYSDRALYPMWAHLEDAIREGSHRWRQTFGWEGSIFDHFFHTPEARQTFLDGMHGFGMLSSPAVARVFNLSRFRHIVDLGGGTGHLAIAVCERYGHMTGTVFDLAEAVEAARRHVEASRAAGRLRLRAGDFFTDPLPEADLYALGRILHDWGEEKIRRLLGRVRAALPEGGGVLIVETLLDDEQPGPVHAQMQSLNMLICTEGRERPAREYAALLESCGFCQVEARRTGAPLDAILAIRKE
jgi:acetylserotonin N-methyltransferase